MEDTVESRTSEWTDFGTSEVGPRMHRGAIDERASEDNHPQFPDGQQSTRDAASFTSSITFGAHISFSQKFTFHVSCLSLIIVPSHPRERNRTTRYWEVQQVR